LGDLFLESVNAVLAKPVRAALTAIGTVLGVATLVVVVGITQTVSAQVSDSFSQADPDIVTAESVSPDGTVVAFTDEEIAGVRRIRGVRRVGVITSAARGLTSVATRWLPVSATSDGAPVIGVSPESLVAVGARISKGRAFDRGHVSRSSRVAVIGVAAARRLRLADVSSRPTIFIGDVPFTVVGIIDATDGHPELLASVTIPPTTLIDLWGPLVVRSSRLVIQTAAAAAPVVGPQVAVAARPRAPGSMRVVTAPRPELLRRNVDRDLTSMLIALAGVALIIGLVGIGNTTLVSVLERIPEFGLRRSLGATRFHNAFQVVAESTLIGGLGGLVGVLLGIIVVVAVSALQAWTPTLDPNVPPLAACVGAAVGMVAGLYPALRASSIEPDEALRR
jgi:putative ABC transport system permease protein